MEELKNIFTMNTNVCGIHWLAITTSPTWNCRTKPGLLGFGGRMHKDYLAQYHPALYNELILSGKLWTYLADLNEQAQDRLNCIISQMKEAEEITEELKSQDQMAWVRAMNSIRSRAEESILRELIYEEDAV